MKSFCLLLFTVISFSSFSQTTAFTSFSSQPFAELSNTFELSNNVVPKPALAPGVRKQRIGKNMTIIGGTLLFGGIVLASTGETYGTTTYNGQTTIHGDGKFVFGVVSAVAGVGLLIPGAIIWSNGNKQYRKYMENELKNNQQTISLGATRNGLSIQYRF